RRHTRSYGDWSSDVCSSDLLIVRMFRSIRLALDFLPPRLRWQWRGLVPLLLACAGAELVAAVALVRFIAVISGRSVLPLPFAERSEERRVGKECRCGRWLDE